MSPENLSDDSHAEPPQVDIYGPARAVQGSRAETHVSDSCRHLSDLVVKACTRLRALMEAALPLLNNTSASRAVSTFRVWGSRSDRSCHHREHTSHRAVGCLNLVASTSSLVGVKPVTHETS